ncbi:hypothetical protein M0L20_07715 [Spirosoma sp. RP8]|uniref:Uncharacterized protein n=1 Tax=Spirosoma liriopis TaxID=2937440 RepID=A0ABT0HJG4_9BACT|nr:hypothetical protein [Spirosoma liriopis]MCK8491735.1 hypothetical protein [Spirosoma liriopis]
MTQLSTPPSPGFYQYTYPTFVDSPQQLYVHFITPDGKNAFVSYPNHPNHKAAGVVALSWFKSVTLTRLEGQPPFMQFVHVTIQGWMEMGCPKSVPVRLHSIGADDYMSELQMFIAA